MSKIEVVYGWHAVKAIIKHNPQNVKKIYIAQERLEQYNEVLKWAQQFKVLTEVAAGKVLANTFPEVLHQGILLEVYADNYIANESDLNKILESLNKPCLILILDSITDPQNLGACLRTADAAGVDCIITNKDRSASITPVVRKVASGAVETVPVIKVTNLARTIEFLKASGIWVYGAAAEARQSIYTLDARGPVAIVMGSEGSGLRRLTKEKCDGLFSIPMLGAVESLNVSAATAVSLYEIVRQRLDANKIMK